MHEPSLIYIYIQINTTNDYIKWLDQVALPVLFPQKLYDQSKLHWRQRQFYSDLTLFRVGPPRLRQLRVKEGSYIFKYTISCPYQLCLEIIILINRRDRRFFYLWITKCMINQQRNIYICTFKYIVILLRTLQFEVLLTFLFYTYL